MQKLLLAVWLSITLNAAWAREAAPVAEDPILEQRMIRLAEDLRCLVCQNESLAGSQADLAEDLRREIRDKMRQGLSDQQVVEYLVARYGDFVLYKPPVKATTWLLWFGPFLLLLTGSGGLFWYLRQRRGRGADKPLSDEERRRAESLLDEKDQGDGR